MTLSIDERAAFVTAYTRVLITSWSDDAFDHRLDVDAVGALTAAGVALPADASVEIVRTGAYPAEQADGADGADATGSGIDKQVELYERELPGGAFTFYVPAAPEVPTQQLAADELHGVAAGGVWDPYCCSCCPNCCSATGG